MGAPVLRSWRTLAPLAITRVDARRVPGAPRADNWWWLRRPPLLTLFGAGLALGMVQSAVLSYLPLYGVEVLGLGAVAAGGLVAAAQAGGPRQSGLLSGVSFAAIVVGLLAGAPCFGAILQATDSYGAAWGAFRALSVLVAVVMALAGDAIHGECERAQA